VFFVVKNRVYPLAGGFGTEYRSVTLGNGSVLADDRLFPPFVAHSAKEVSGGTPNTARETHALLLRAACEKIKTIESN